MEKQLKEFHADFYYPLTANDEINPGDEEYEKILEKEIESNCTFNKYVDKLKLRDDFTDEELLTKKGEEIISYKNEQITKLKAYIASLEQEKEDLINNFKNTTNALLDKIKNLELQLNHNNNNNQNIIIERPQTAMIARDLQDIENNDINQNIDNNNNKVQRCPNCQKEIPQNEFIIHSLSCLRHSYKCKKCGELINDEILEEHNKSWLKPDKIYSSIINKNLEEFICILNHGLKDDCIIDEKNGDYIYHLICRKNNFKFLKELNKRKLKFNLDMINKNKETPLITAISNNSLECAEIMIEFGANITLRNKGDLSPLMLACKYGYSNLVELLINKGADINEKNILGETPLSLAQINKHDDLAMKILQKSQLKF
jgi:hypothetical protein